MVDRDGCGFVTWSADHDGVSFAGSRSLEAAFALAMTTPLTSTSAVSGVGLTTTLFCLFGTTGAGGGAEAAVVAGADAAAVGAFGKDPRATMPIRPAMVIPPATKVIAVAVDRRMPDVGGRCIVYAPRDAWDGVFMSSTIMAAA